MKYLTVLIFCCIVTTQALAATCADITSPDERLKCYDQQHAPMSHALDSSSRAFTYVQHAWELAPEYHKPLFSFRAHHPNYILPMRYTSSTNPTPQSPTHPNTQSKPTQAYEVRFQLSFKTKLKEHILGSKLSAWFAYTQQSNWQFYNTQQSAPFRESNYQPELILSLPTNLSFQSLRLPMVRMGIVHQSNGQSGVYSRSWNRVYMGASLTHGNWLADLRLWQRLPESIRNDDNPDIMRYMGHGQLNLSWFQEHHRVSIQSRYSFSGHKGAIRANWVFPVNGHLKGYIEVFDGYGETLIDYNHYQQIIAAGFLLSTWH